MNQKNSSDILKVDKQKKLDILEHLNRIYIEEWKMSYKFFLASEMFPVKDDLRVKFESLSIMERNHAKTLLQRIIKLGGTPVDNPMEPSDHPLGTNITRPHTAIRFWMREKNHLYKNYNKLLEKLQTLPVSKSIIQEILIEEKQIEDELEKMQEMELTQKL